MTVSDPRALLDTIAAGETKFGEPVAEVAHNVLAALRAVLDHMDLAVELMPNTPAVPVSVLRSVITRALEEQ